MAGLRLGPYPLAMVCERLAAFAAEYGKGGRPTQFVLFGNVLVTEQQVLAQPGLMMKIISHHRRLEKVMLPLTASIVFANSNIRVVGLGGDGGPTAKVNIGHGGRPFGRELCARRHFSATLEGEAAVRVPKLREADTRRALWLVEEFVAARHLNSVEMARFLAGPAEALYRPTVRLRAISRAVAGAYGDIEMHLPRLALRLANAALPVAFGHGDLQLKNVLIDDDGRFWPIDMENAGAMAIARDLATACVEEPLLTPVAVKLLTRLTPAGALSAEKQLAVGFIALLPRLRERRATMINDRVAHTGAPRVEVEALIDGRYQGVISQAQALAAGV
jgi:hypothetical protein